MTARKKDKAGLPRRDVTLVFGENDHDRRAIKALAEGIRPSWRGSIVVRADPLVLLKNARPEDMRSRAEKLAKVVAAEKVRHDVRCVLVHEDADDIEPEHLTIAHDAEAELAKAGCPAHYVVPAWEIEAWWFLWPDAAPLVERAWRRLDDFEKKNVGKIRNAKEQLGSRLIPTGLPSHLRAHVPKYREADSIRFAEVIRDQGWCSAPRGKSASYDRFRAHVEDCRGLDSHTHMPAT